jgi:hypothetical protein
MATICPRADSCGPVRSYSFLWLRLPWLPPFSKSSGSSWFLAASSVCDAIHARRRYRATLLITMPVFFVVLHED